MARRARQCPDVRGWVAVVTGASSGIGRRLALTLAQRGALVIGIARRADLLDELVIELRKSSPESRTVVCDVGDRDRYATLLREIEAEFDRIDLLVNNAGIEQLTRAQDGYSDAYDRIFAVNVFGVMVGTLTVLPGMLARGSGVVVNVASDSARAPEPGHGAYSASKAAVAAFTESVAHEVAPKGVSVHALYPAWVATAMGMSGNEDGGALPPKALRRTETQIAALVLARIGGPRFEINAAALPLLAPISRTIAPRTYQRTMRSRSQ